MVARLADSGHALDPYMGAVSRRIFEEHFLPTFEEDLAGNSVEWDALLVVHGEEHGEYSYNYYTEYAQSRLRNMEKVCTGEPKASQRRAIEYKQRPYSADAVRVIFVYCGYASVFIIEVSSAPDGVIGCSSHGTLDTRACVNLVDSASVDYVSGAQGTVTVELFNSNDDEDRGGVVLRIKVRNGECSFIPHAKNIPNGVELHLAGEAEGESLLLALKELLAKQAPADYRFVETDDNTDDGAEQ